MFVTIFFEPPGTEVQEINMITKEIEHVRGLYEERVFPNQARGSSVHSLKRRFALPLGRREDEKVEWYRTEAVTPPRVVGTTPMART